MSKFATNDTRIYLGKFRAKPCMSSRKAFISMPKMSDGEMPAASGLLWAFASSVNVKLLRPVCSAYR